METDDDEGPPMLSASAALRAGTPVWALLRFKEREAYEVPDDVDTGNWPSCVRAGRTDGWFAATLRGDWPAAGSAETVEVDLVGHWVARDGMDLSPEERRRWVETSNVALRSASRRRKRPSAYTFVTVRARGVVAPDYFGPEWGPAGASVSDEYIEAVVDEQYRRNPKGVEVVALWVDWCLLEDVSEGKLTKQWARHVVDSGAAAVAAYFMWPTERPPSSQFGEHGVMPAAALFDLMGLFESVGVPTMHPHPLETYRLLVSKRWAAQFSSSASTKLHVANTVVVDRADVVLDADRAAEKALKTLEWYDALSIPKAMEAGHVAVLKEPYSWEGKGVRIVDTVAELAAAMRAAGSQTCASQFLVQRYMPNTFELRVYVIGAFRPRPRLEFAYTTFEDGLDEEGRVGKMVLKSRDKAIAEWLEGDDRERLMKRVEEGAERVVGRWLEILQRMSLMPMPSIRIDFLVSMNCGAPLLTTLELTEAGFSFLGWNEGPDLVFEALAEACEVVAARRPHVS